MTNLNHKFESSFMLKTAVSLICSVGTQLAHADLDTAKQWLSTQKSTNSSVANPLQTSQEVSSILGHLKTSNSLEPSTTTVENETSTEGLVRQILIAKANQQALPQAWQVLALNQNEDGGLGHIEGWQSNPLDTAYTLIALQESGYLATLDDTTKAQWQNRIAKALYYLATQQQADGSYKIAYLDDLYINSYVLSAITPYLKQYGRYLPTAQKLVTYLQSKQTATSTWSTRANNSGLFIDALVAESLYPYQTSQTAETFKNNFTNRVLSLQNADGSWQQDAYVTAIVMRSLESLSKFSVNPMLGSFSLALQDSETGSLLSNATVVLVSNDKTLNLVTDLNGNLTATDLPAGKYTISISKPGYVTSNFEANIQTSTQTNFGIIKLSRSSEKTTSFVQGTVLRQDNNLPLSGVIVKVYYQDKIIQTVTNAQGDYQIAVPYAGSFAVEAFYEGLKTSGGTGILNFGQTFSFSPKLYTLDYQTTDLIGKVIDEEGRPMTNVQVYINGQHLATSLSDGSYRINDYKVEKSYWDDYLESIKPSGFELKDSLVVTAKYNGYDTILREFTLEENAVNDLSTIIMYALDPNRPNEKPPGMIPGTVNFKFIDKATGNPLNGVKVFFDKVNSQGEVFFKGSYNAYSSEDTKMFTNGNWLFYASKRNYLISTPLSVHLDANGTQTVTLELEQQGVGTVDINVFNKLDNNQAVYNAKIIAEQLGLNGEVIDTLRFNLGAEQAKGQIKLLEGKWQIKAEHDSYETSTAQTINVQKDGTYKVDIGLSYPAYNLTARLVDSQTNKSLNGAKVAVYIGESDKALATLTSDANGVIKLPNVIASHLRLVVDATNYLGSTYYVDKSFLPKGDVDMGEIRLRPKSADVVLPDLSISKTTTDKLATEQQTLNMSGELGITIENKGNTELNAKAVNVLAFIDSNKDRKFNDNEQVVGSQAIDLMLLSGAQAKISLPVKGKLNFKDAPIAIMVDSNGQVAEKDENNNLRLTSDGIQIKPKQGTMEAETIWQYNLSSDSGAIAAPLSDTNGDGIIGNGDISSILVFKGQYYVLDGKTGKEQFRLAGSGAQELAAVGDVDGDKIPDIIVTASDGLRVYDNKGQLKKTLKASLNFSGWSSDAYHPIIADIDQDGVTEIIQNNKIFSYEQGLIKDGLPSGQSQAVADMNGDGILDIIGLSGVSDNKGNLLYNFKYPNGSNIVLKFVAIGDVLGTKKPQVIAIYGNQILIIDGKTGQTIANYNAPASQGGSPVIADFDGDGKSDIGVARTYNYVAMRGDGSIIWNTPISDSSGGTGSTVFDFDNDGKTEAIHFDEQNLRIYDAATGVERIKMPNSTATAHEYPIVGDFDGDGHADIIITSGNGNGVRMISSKNKDWANTRNIWNQYSYHVTNINDDLTVPTKEANSWEVHNTYRANLLLNQNATAAVDLTTSYLQVKDNGNQASQFTARIGNAGGKTAKAGTPVSFYQKDSTGQSKLLGVVALPKDLASDEYIDLSLNYSPLTGNLHDFGELVVIANDAGAGIDSATGIPNPTDPTKPVDAQGVIQEYSRTNNIATLAVTGDFAGFSLSANLDKTSYAANETVTITSTPTNLGSFDTSPTVKVSIIDSAGNVVATYPDQAVTLSSAITGQATGSNTTAVQNFWNTSQQRTGNYTAHVELVHNNKTVASIDRPFAIVADGVAAGQVTSQLGTDKTQYNTTDLVQVHSRLINTASNAMATARNVVLLVKNEQGQTIWTQNYGYAELSPNVIKDQYFSVPLNNVKQGKYSVVSITTAPDGSQTQQTLQKDFEVLSAAQTGINISGTIQSPTSVEIGTNIPLHWQVNNGNAQALANVPVSIALYKGESDTPFVTLPVTTANIDANGKVIGDYAWLAQGDENDKITAVLVGQFGTTQKSLATTSFTLSMPAVKATLASVPKADTLLVYYACEDGWYTSLNNSGGGNFDYPCFNEREATIRSYLDRMGVNYKLVKTPWDFRQELQSGVYGQYWLLGAIENLSPHLYNEVVEMTHAGQNILFDSGTHSWLNQDLYKLANVKYNGRLLLETGEITPNPTYFPMIADSQIASSKLSTLTKIAGQPFNSNWAILLEPKSSGTQSLATFSGAAKQVGGVNQSAYPNQTYNAMTAATYGNGVPVVVTFDLISSLDFAKKSALPPYQNNANVMQLRWDSILEQLLRSRTIKPRSEYVPNEPVRIPLNVVNEASLDRKIQVDIKLPAGSTWLGYQGGVKIVPTAELEQHYQVTLKPKQSLQDVLAIRLPQASGTHSVQITVNDITNPNQPRKLEQFEPRFLVRDINSRMALLKQAIDPWKATGVNGVQVMNAKVKLSLIQTHLNTGVDELAVYELGNLAHILSDMQTTPEQNAPAVRYETDELLKALQIKWYLARQGKPPLP